LRHGVALLSGISTPSLAAQGGQRLPSYFNINRDIPDATVREEILAVLKNEPWAPVASIDVTVHEGIVDLWGTIMDERARQALIVAIENVAGVKGINDHLAWIEPTSGIVIEKA
jgi:osmotically-inducible protein OsmY